MNEELQNALAEILNKTVDGMTAAGAFLESEIPEVIMQLLRWRMAESLLMTAVWIVFAWLCVGGFRKAANLNWEDASEKEQTFAGMRVVASLCLLLPLAMEFGYDWLQIWLAPKVYLIEYAANLAK
jgi:phosphatidylserine synthase